jgi:hypothetical protein
VYERQQDGDKPRGRVKGGGVPGLGGAGRVAVGWSALLICDWTAATRHQIFSYPSGLDRRKSTLTFSSSSLKEWVIAYCHTA